MADAQLRVLIAGGGALDVASTANLWIGERARVSRSARGHLTATVDAALAQCRPNRRVLALLVVVAVERECVHTSDGDQNAPEQLNLTFR